VLLLCAISLCSVVTQRLECNTGKVFDCLIQFLLSMVLSIEERVFFFLLNASFENVIDIQYRRLYRRSWTSLPTPPVSAQRLSEHTVLNNFHKTKLDNYENNQKDALYRLIYYSKSALHVSGDVFLHHQEHLTLFTVFRSVDPSCCRLVPAATWVNTTGYCKYSQVLLMMGESIA